MDPKGDVWALTSHFRFAPDRRRIAVSQQTTFRAMNDFLHCRRKASLFADDQQDPVTRISVK
jgi:hypothetical protein